MSQTDAPKPAGCTGLDLSLGLPYTVSRIPALHNPLTRIQEGSMNSDQGQLITHDLC